MHEELEKLNDQIVRWAEDRLILANGKAITQMDKTIEEIEELIEAIGKHSTYLCPGHGCLPDIYDAIGDIYVTLVVGLAIDDLGVPPMMVKPSPSKKPVQELLKSVFLLGGCFMIGNQAMRLQQVLIMMNLLAAIAEKYDTTLRACVAGAYEAIKDRRGYLNEQGIFVKEVPGGN